VLISGLLPERTPRRDSATALNALIAAMLVLMLAVFPWLRLPSADTSNSTSLKSKLLHAPERFTDAVRAAAKPGAQVFVAQIWASWFELEAPDYPVFIDPRIELFPAEVWHEYDIVSRAGAGWEAILDRWNVDVLVLSREQQDALISSIADDASWTPIYRNADGAALVRISSP
jgi:hypothetical protein